MLRFIIFTTLLLKSISLFSYDLDNLKFYGHDGTLSFKDGILELVKFDRDTGEEIHIKDSFIIEEDNGILFIKYGDGFSKKFLALYNTEIIFLYNEKNSFPTFWGVEKSPRHIETVFFNKKAFKASSYLVEGETTYDESNLGDIRIAKPWVESSEGYGINETIKFKGNVKTNSLIFSNGFVSYENPSLYTRNSRIKKLQITNNISGKITVYDIQDTPNIQILDFDSSTNDIEMKILEVYEGESWKDTCINIILFKF